MSDDVIELSPRGRPRTRGSTRWQTGGSHYKSPSAVWAARLRVADPRGEQWARVLPEQTYKYIYTTALNMYINQLIKQQGTIIIIII